MVNNIYQIKMKQQQNAMLFVAFTFILSGCKKIDDCTRHYKNDPIPQLSRICFGSCSSQNKAQPILNTIVDKKPDLFIYAGDNMYADTDDMKAMEAEYYKLCKKDEFQRLISNVKTIATWDDHDYGANDSGKHYSKKAESKLKFLNFWGEFNNLERAIHEGIYTSYYWGDSIHRVQVILLDCRTFRDDLLTNANGNYIQNTDPNVTILGSEQWNWLKTELTVPAKIRIIVSSTQFARTHDGYEAWDNFPHEQEKMIQTIKDAHANGVVFISGDVHLGELSKINPAGLYPIYDLTSSGLTQLEGSDVPNTNRVGDVELDYNFGMIDIDWQDPNNVLLNMKIGLLQGTEKLKYSIPLNDLQF